jgi:hypothetical protein
MNTGENLVTDLPYLMNKDFCMERLFDAAMAGKSQCFKVYLSLADEMHYRVIRLRPSHKRGVAFFFYSQLSDQTCSYPHILDHNHCLSPDCVRENPQPQNNSIPINSDNLISTGEIDVNGNILSLVISDKHVWEARSQPEIGDNVYEGEIPLQFEDMRIWTRCLKNAVKKRQPQCLKTQWNWGENSHLGCPIKRTKLPTQTMIRILPAQENTARWYECHINDHTCRFPQHNSCLQGYNPDCEFHQKISAA